MAANNYVYKTISVYQYVSHGVLRFRSDVP
jgi:hypothetical protein